MQILGNIWRIKVKQLKQDLLINTMHTVANTTEMLYFKGKFCRTFVQTLLYG